MDGVIVVGGGIAGLYYAYRYLQKHPKARLVLLERSGRLGGRAGISTFQGLRVMCGAGIGRKAKDKHLLELLDELGVPHREFEVTHTFAPTVEQLNVTDTMAMLAKATASSYQSTRQTFKKLATKVLGAKKYGTFVKATGYTDFEQADVMDVIKYYGMEDNAENWVGVGVPWDTLIQQLQEHITTLGGTILTNHSVDKVTDLPAEGVVKVHCANGACYVAAKLVLATTADVAKDLLPQHRKLLSNTCGQPFIRVYAKVGKGKAAMRTAVPSLTIVPPPLQKIIPIDPSKGVYMIAYADNQAALHLHSALSQSSEPNVFFARLLETSLGLETNTISIAKLQPHFHNVGTHYNKPLPPNYKTRQEFLKAVQRPSKTIAVIGEMVALHQGWVEGALESVHAII